MACVKLDQCMLGVTCEQLSGFIDCETEQGVCIGECVLAVDCAELLNLPQSDCVAACQGGQGGAGGGGDCLGCTQNSCPQELFACAGDNGPCAAFLTCAQACAPGDDACLLTCAADNPSPATTTLVDCSCANCAGSCPCSGTGVGGAGGAGQGGAGGVMTSSAVGVGGAGGAGGAMTTSAVGAGGSAGGN
jgi:hypothetical protein